jgi:DNA-binding winged helix-turn-helix (wHTH) protein
VGQNKPPKWAKPSCQSQLSLDRGEVVSRRQLMQAVWGTTIVSNGALDTLVNTLREKIHAKQPGLISTARGVGYSLVEDADL